MQRISYVERLSATLVAFAATLSILWAMSGYAYPEPLGAPANSCAGARGGGAPS
jgi:hypothetical protein